MRVGVKLFAFPRFLINSVNWERNLISPWPWIYVWQPKQTDTTLTALTVFFYVPYVADIFFMFSGKQWINGAQSMFFWWVQKTYNKKKTCSQFVWLQPCLKPACNNSWMSIQQWILSYSVRKNYDNKTKHKMIYIDQQAYNLFDLPNSVSV